MHGRDDRGFTLIEILIVVTIIGLLVGFVATRLIKTLGTTERTIAEAQLEKLESTLELYRVQNGRYPTAEQGLAALVRRPSSEPIPRSYPPAGYLEEKQLRDPWGGRYVYALPGVHNPSAFDLSSLGPDGREGGEGDAADVVNWDLDAR